MPPSVRSPLGAATVALVAAFALAACGGSGSSAAHGSAGGSHTQGDALVAWARCIRSHGIPNFPDPIAGQGLSIQHELDGSVELIIDGQLTPVSAPALQRAMSACHSDDSSAFGQVVTPGQMAQINQERLAMAKCMRSHGVPSFPDPNLNPRPGSHLSATGVALSAGINVDSPAFRRADSACGSIMTRP